MPQVNHKTLSLLRSLINSSGRTQIKKEKKKKAKTLQSNYLS